MRRMQRFNIANPTFEYDPDDPHPFRGGRVRVGPLVGASATGMSVYEMPPGEGTCPYHYEYGEEEWLLVLEGRPTLRHPDGDRPARAVGRRVLPLRPRGRPRGAQRDRGDLRFLMFSTIVHPAASVYPDSGKVAIWTGNRDDDVLVRRTSAVDYYDGEVGVVGRA